jgi:hypothetical protein
MGICIIIHCELLHSPAHNPVVPLQTAYHWRVRLASPQTGAATNVGVIAIVLFLQLVKAFSAT